MKTQTDTANQDSYGFRLHGWGVVVLKNNEITCIISDDLAQKLGYPNALEYCNKVFADSKKFPIDWPYQA